MENDALLINRLQKNDHNAFRELADRYTERLRMAAGKILGDHTQAADVVQETFLAFFRTAGSFRGQSGIFTYLYRITVNKAIDIIRKKNREKKFYFLPQAREEHTDVSIVVREALGRLPDNQRLPLIMAEIDRLSYEKIAAELALPVNTVRTRIFRARKKLYNILLQMGVTL